MPTNSHAVRPNSIRKSAGILRKDLADAGSRLLTDSKDLASVGTRGIADFVKSPPFLVGAVAFVVGGVLGSLLRRR